MKRLTLRQRKEKRDNLIGVILIGVCTCVVLVAAFGYIYASANLVNYI